MRYRSTDPSRRVEARRQANLVQTSSGDAGPALYDYDARRTSQDGFLWKIGCDCDNAPGEEVKWRPMRIQRGALTIAPGQHLPAGDDHVPITTRRCHGWIHGTLDHDLLRVIAAHLDDVRPCIESDGHPDGQQVARRQTLHLPRPRCFDGSTNHVPRCCRAQGSSVDERLEGATREHATVATSSPQKGRRSSREAPISLYPIEAPRRPRCAFSISRRATVPPPHFESVVT